MDKKKQDIIKNNDENHKHIEGSETLQPDAMSRVKSKKVARMLGVAVIFGAVIIGAVSLYLRSPKQEGPTKTDASKEIQQNLETADSYDVLYSYFKKKGVTSESVPYDYAMEGSVIEENTTAGGARMLESAVGDSAAGSYSNTNVRQEGVDEADIVKTDGSYLYAMKDSRQEIAVVNPAAGAMEVYSTIKLDDGYIEEFYLSDSPKKLIVITSISGTNGEVMPLAESRSAYGGLQTTQAITYDISEPQSPKEEGRVSQSGSYKSSRMSGDHLYLFSLYFIHGEVSRQDKKTYIPYVNDKALSPERIFLPDGKSAQMYMVVTSVDMKNPGETTDSKAVMSKNSELYVSNENIYLYEANTWSREKMKTAICKIAYKEGSLDAVGKGEIDGYIQDSFSIDEYNENLRVVTTVEDTNAVYILNAELQEIGSITGLAKEERVYSARFMGEIGYFVTFRETDPLYSVDLSDPTNPKILGELKIPGFSEYLHPYGENKLLGIGMDVDEKTSVTGGVKLSMFDTTDKTDVKEVSTFVLKNVYSADILYDYKAALLDTTKNLIGFSAYPEGAQRYYLFRYDAVEGFQSLMEHQINGNTLVSPRGIYINNVLYVASGNVIESYSLETYTKIGDIIL